MLNFELYQTPMTGEKLTAVIFAGIIFIVIPIILAVIEYCVTAKNKKHGFRIMAVTLISALLLGWYSLLVGLLLGIVYWRSSLKYNTMKFML